MVATLGRQRIHYSGGRITTDETARMSEVVDARHDQAEDEQQQGVAHRFGTDEAASAFAAVMDESSEQAEDRRGGADGKRGTVQERNRKLAEDDRSRRA